MAYQINQKMCSCCHQCKIACPVGAVHFKNAKYWIDPEKCIGCGACARNCHNCAITPVGGEPEAVPGHAPLRRDCDLAVVGGGGAGLVCAVRFAQLTGKKVIVLEKSAKPGGNTWYASGFGAHYSALHAEAGIPDNREEAMRRFLMETLQQEDPQLINHVFHATEEFLNWLMDYCDCREDFILGKNPPGDTIVKFRNKTGRKWKRLDTSIGPGGAGSFVIDRMLGKAKELGVEILTSHEAKALLTDSQGAVVGVEAADPGGITTVYAKTVVMATGCFSHNEELLRRCCPEFFLEGEPVHRFSVPTCTGDGIRMCQAIGADIDYENTQALVLGPAHHPYAFSLVCLVREGEIVMVDRNGRRFGSEEGNGMSMRRITHRLPSHDCWAIADGELLETLAQRLMELAMDGPDGVEIVRNYREDLEEEEQLGLVCRADTLAELAQKMGVPEENLVRTMENYNRFCAQGRDEEFFKAPRALAPIDKPPYYAIYCKMFQENAVGGMKIDSQVRVLDKNGAPIPNLYAVGDNTRGVRLAGDLGPDLVERNISNLTWALSSGFMAGEHAAEANP